MNLYIQLKDAVPVNHPATEENLIQVFGSVPSDWVPFDRVNKPTPGLYQVLDSQESTYGLVNGVWSDIWTLRDMIADEKAAAQQSVKDAWVERPNAENFTAWTYDEATNSYIPPTPKPEGDFVWRGLDNSWAAVPQKPTDGQTYKLDLATVSWVVVPAA